MTLVSVDELLGCVYCESNERSTSLCCSRHVRLVCDECREHAPGFAVDHRQAA